MPIVVMTVTNERQHTVGGDKRVFGWIGLENRAKQGTFVKRRKSRELERATYLVGLHKWRKTLRTLKISNNVEDLAIFPAPNAYM